MTKNENSVDTIQTEYHQQSVLYHEYCSTLYRLLVELLDNKGYKYQISMRVKSLDSVAEKIVRDVSRRRSVKHLGDLNDIAGIRIVFYLESDKRRFIKTLYGEFTPEKMAMKEHHQEKGYRSTHIVLQFGKKRLALNEYRKFSGLKCELQLTSALYHAWAEIEHDIFYKQSTLLKTLDDATELQLKRELEVALVDYIQNASDVFERVARKVRSNAKRRA